MRTQKHKILSIVVLNMAKYTIISQVQKSPKLILGEGGQPISKKSQPREGGGGVIFTLDAVQSFLSF